MRTENVTIPDKVTEYVRAVIFMEELPSQYQQREAERVRGLWEELNARPFYLPTGVDWSEVVADWHGGYLHDPDMTTDEIMEGLREIAEGYAEQTEYDDCRTCGRTAWLGTVGDCSECD